MSRRFLAVALALVMIAAVVVVLAPASGLGTQSHSVGDASPATASRPSVGPEYDLLNGYGNYAYNTYYIGEVGDDALNFYIYDAVDHDVNVTLTDPNASRDGVASPAFTYEAPINATTHNFYSYKVGVQYTFPKLAYGGTWVVNFSAPNAGYVTQNISLEVFEVDASASVSTPDSTLPGMPVSVYWWAYYDSNGATPYPGATSVWLWGNYTGNGTAQNLFPGGKVQLATGSWGIWNGTVPLNASANSQLQFTITVITAVNGVIAENESDYLAIDVGHLVRESTGITDFPAYCLGDDDDYLTANTTVASCIQFGSKFGGLSTITPVAGLPVTIAYWNGLTHVTPTGGAPTTAMTDSNGEVEVVFQATSPPFLNYLQYPYFGNAVNFSATVPGANSTGAHWTIWYNVTDWAIDTAGSGTGVVNSEFDATEYFAGSTAIVNWSISSTDSSVTGPITANGWYVGDDDAENTAYATGTLSGTAQSGTIHFAITPAMVGHELIFDVYASNATTFFVGYAFAAVIAPTLLVTASASYYTAGSSVSATVALAGSAAAPAGTTITWQAWGYWDGDYAADVLIGSGTVANGGSFSFPIASSTPPQGIDIDAWASSGGQVLVTGGTEVDLAMGYSVLLGVGTVSNYADGSYQPGQTVTLNYQVVGIDGTPLPQSFTFDLYVAGLPFEQEIQNAAPTGSVQFTIPSNAPAGGLVVVLEVEATLTGGSCASSLDLDDGACTGVTTLTVNPHPSALSMELGAGSGLTVGWLILLVIIILVAIVLFLVLRRRGGSNMSGGGTNTTTPMSPPAAAPSSPPPTEWQHPDATNTPSGDSQPPLPPPAGSS
jgi:hypothetical protein